MQQKSDSMEWLLNLASSFPRYELFTNLKTLPKTLSMDDCIISQTLYTYDDYEGKFILKEIKLYSNMIVCEDKFLILSTCTIEKKTIQYGEFQIKGIVLVNQMGYFYIFFETLHQLYDWQRQIKQFCILGNFLQKFTLKERHTIQNVFACIKNKTGKLHTVQIYKLTELEKNPYNYEQLMNEINIMMSIKHPSLLPYNSIFQDQQNMYILYEYWVGDPLFKLIEQGLKLSSIQQSNLIYQILRIVRILHSQQLYHAQITPQSIIMMRSFTQVKQEKDFQLALTNFAYREDIQSAQLIRRLPKQWIPPELFVQPKPHNPELIDQYQIGATLFYIVMHEATFCTTNIFAKTCENMELSYNLIINEQQKKDSKFTLSQIDLLLNLMNPDPKNRKDIQMLLNHHWFVNQQAKVKNQNNNKFLPSLRTILEIREFSSLEIYVRRSEQEPLSIESMLEDETEEDDLDNLDQMCDENMQIHKFIQHLNSQALIVKKL